MCFKTTMSLCISHFICDFREYTISWKADLWALIFRVFFFSLLISQLHSSTSYSTRTLCLFPGGRKTLKLILPHQIIKLRLQSHSYFIHVYNLFFSHLNTWISPLETWRLISVWNACDKRIDAGTEGPRWSCQSCELQLCIVQMFCIIWCNFVVNLHNCFCFLYLFIYLLFILVICHLGCFFSSIWLLLCQTFCSKSASFTLAILSLFILVISGHYEFNF